MINTLIFVVLISKTASYYGYTREARKTIPIFKKSVLLGMVFILAGLPPVSFFFFKIFILLHVRNTALVVYLMCFVNVVALYYYLNFVIYTARSGYGTKETNVLKLFLRDCNKYLTVSAYYYLIFYCFFINFYFVFFLEFLLSIVMGF